MDNCRELLSDSTRLVRGIHRDHIKDGGKRIHKAAFIPRKSTADKPSPDEDGLSVSELRDDIALLSRHALGRRVGSIAYS